jgi:hypothetical protein
MGQFGVVYLDCRLRQFFSIHPQRQSKPGITNFSKIENDKEKAIQAVSNYL